MIRHRPWGSGHAYQHDVDQRIPIHPVADLSLQLGAVASADATAVVCEITTVHSDGRTTTKLIDAELVDAAAHADTGATTGGEGHLASAQAGIAVSGSGWAAQLTAVRGARYRYRFIASRPSGEERTRYFNVAVAEWIGVDALRVVGDGTRVAPGSVECLTDGERVWGVRFALRLAVGEKVVGFGERFERLDQRGHRLDAHVFE